MTNYAAAIHLDGTLVGPAGPFARPAVPGEVIEIYGTGFGATTPALPGGQMISEPAPIALPAAGDQPLQGNIGGFQSQAAVMLSIASQ